MPFRLLNDNQKFPKYTWITVNAERNSSDFRPESYRPDIDTLRVETISRSRKTPWDERRKIILSKQNIYTNIESLIVEAKSKARKSLAIFKPTQILDFIITETSRQWDNKKMEALYNRSRQLNFFKSVETVKNEFKVVQKIPYRFSYRFKDDCGTLHTLMVEDWETGMLYLNCLKQSNQDEKIAVEKVKKKYLDDFLKRDLYFFLGTTKAYHLKSVNPFIIIGVFPSPMPSTDIQLSLFDANN